MGNDTILDPEQVLQRLQAGAKSQRTRDSLGNPPTKRARSEVEFST